MQDNVSVLIATIMFVMIIVLFPIYNLANRHDSVANNVVVEATTAFVDDIREQGYIKKSRYQEYINKINATGNFFEIELEVYRKIIIKDKEGNYIEDYEIVYLQEILEKMEERVEKGDTDIEQLNAVSNTLNDENSIEITGVYLLNQGDKVYARVKNTNMTQAQVLLQNLFGGSLDARILINYGGEIYGEKWARSNLVEGALANISLSRPMRENGEEYTMRAVAIQSAEEGEELAYAYGIAVPIKLATDVIRFDITYSNTTNYNFTLDEYNKVISPEDFISLEGFTGDIELRRISQDSTSAKYSILIDNIKIGNGLEEATCQVRVAEGTAIAANGERVGSIVSTEFIIYQGQDNFEIANLEAVQYFHDSGKNLQTWSITSSGYAKRALWNGKYVDSMRIGLKAPESAEDGRNIQKYIWTISSASGHDISDGTLRTDLNFLRGNFNQKKQEWIVETTKNEIFLWFNEEFVSEENLKNGLAKGNYVKVRAVDEDGNYSKTKGVAFATIDNYMNKQITGAIATVRTLDIAGAYVNRATINLGLANTSHGTLGIVNNGDRFRVIGIDYNNRKVILVDKPLDSIQYEYNNKKEAMMNSIKEYTEETYNHPGNTARWYEFILTSGYLDSYPTKKNEVLTYFNYAGVNSTTKLDLKWLRDEFLKIYEDYVIPKETQAQKNYANKIIIDDNAEMFFIDINGNGVYDTEEYYVANDIYEIGNYNEKQLGFKTTNYGYSYDYRDAEDIGLYYWVRESLNNLNIVLKNNAKYKYKSIIFDYKIIPGHEECLQSETNISSISCTVETNFND